jgi:hypothetical protein
MDPSAKAEFEKDEPISYRGNYILLICSFIASIAIFMVCGIDPIATVLTSINLICMWIVNLRFFGLVGVNIARLERDLTLLKSI